ncbi:MAG: DUF87 domain-containing protein [bacterium]|nr:DUF87 domain-containing protein [bacterium]
MTLVPTPTQYEKLGKFYLGATLGSDGKRTEEALLYDAKDLTTHAVCLGMTGSGKTGLCVSLLEEAALDGIPAIVIDPKGDLGNLLLTFPDLTPADFRPWIDEAEAGREGRTPDEHARAVAGQWKKGLAEWGQDGSRIRAFREAVDLAIYTPGSSAGRPLRVLKTLAAPPEALRGDADVLRERIQASVSGLLALLGIDPDPIRSREHILISNVMDRAWSAGRDLDLAGLIREIQSPPFDRVGVFDLESFFPAEDRLTLAMTLNNLLASPSFSSWMEGEPLDIGRLLYTPEGKPRLSILSIAHLSESERMFFVTLLLNEMVTWMRSQPGTNSLRALLYMDEVFGYFPPTANPPSKMPMLTLLKQARAYGLGCVLATQNPVDLDYKGLSNTGTWLLGRLQTERDKLRVIEGLEGASATTGAAFDRGKMERLLAGLGNRTFLVHNVHEDGPVLFQTRWAMSYLRGPLTRKQIASLTAKPDIAAPAESQTALAPPAIPDPSQAAAQPAVAPEVDQAYRPVVAPTGEGVRIIYRPCLFGVAGVHYANARAHVDRWESVGVLVPLAGSLRGSPWDDEGSLTIDPQQLDLENQPYGGAEFGDLPSAATRTKSYPRWSKMLKGHIYRECVLGLWACKALKAISKPGESEGDFRARLRMKLHEQRDLEIEKLRKKYASKIARIESRIRRAEAKLEREEEQYDASKRSTAISIGATLLGALFGRKLGSSRSVGRATTAVRGASRTITQHGDIDRAEEGLEAVREQLAEMEQELQGELARVRNHVDESGLELAPLPVRTRKSDTAIERVSLVWVPWRVGVDGIAEPAWE